LRWRAAGQPQGPCRSNHSGKRDLKAQGGPRATPEEKSPIRPSYLLTFHVTHTILASNANRAPHRRPSLPIPPRGWCTPRPPARRRGAERHCPWHHPRRYPTAPGRAANRPPPPRGAGSASPRAHAFACPAPAAPRSPFPVASAAPRASARRPSSLPPRSHQPPCISQPGRHALHPGGIPPAQPQSLCRSQHAAQGLRSQDHRAAGIRARPAHQSGHVARLGHHGSRVSVSQPVAPHQRRAR
jgi:hypothetical protein